MLAAFVAFVLGAAGGYVYGRWRPAANQPPEARPEPSPASTAAADGGPPVLAKPNKRGRKAGLTEADFTPSDDILERLRRVEAGELDPSHLRDETAEPPKAKPARKAPPAAPAVDPLTMTEAERRVFERLRRMEEEAAPEE